MTYLSNPKKGRVYLVPVYLTIAALLVILGWYWYSGTLLEYQEIALDAENTRTLPFKVGSWWYLSLIMLWAVLFYFVSQVKGLNRVSLMEGVWVGSFPSLVVGMIVFMTNEEAGVHYGLRIGMPVAMLFGCITGLSISVQASKISGGLMGIVFSSGLVLVTALALFAEPGRKTFGQIEGFAAGLFPGFAVGIAFGMFLTRIDAIEKAVRRAMR